MRTKHAFIVSCHALGARATYILLWNICFLYFIELKIQKISVQNQKMPQFSIGTNVSFEQNSKVHFTVVRYNISKGIDDIEQDLRLNGQEEYLKKCSPL